MQPSPVVQINHAMAVSYARSVTEAIALLDHLDDTPNFADYQPYHAAKADLFARTGDVERAKLCYDRAITLTDDPAEQAFLSGQRNKLSS
jgi:RNA polymerase sigma-70 factor (ECF subfamily)